ncbi:MAG: type II secretion system secretin GspD [Methylosarcina sp.]
MLSSCELLGPKQSAKLPLYPVPKEQENGQPEVLFEELQNKPPVSDSMQSKVELYPGTDRLVSAPKARYEQKAKSTGAELSVNFDEADLGEVAKVILGDILGYNYVLSPKVAGKVTLNTTLSKEELLPTLEKVLRQNNAALVKAGRVYHIEPAADALYSSDVTSRGGGGDSGFQARVIPIRYVSATDVAEVIKPLVPEKTVVNVDATHNTIVVSGTADEVDRVMDLVSTFDIDILRGRSFGLYPLSHVAPEDIIKELESIFAAAQEKKEGGEFFRFLAIDRLNAVLAITHQSRYLADIENWVLRLDRASSANGGGVNVYKVQHMDAVELADTLNSIFTGAQKQSKAAKVAPGETAATITNKQTSDRSSTRRQSPGGGQQTGEEGVSNVGDVRIIADQANNSIITVATPQEYEVILPIIQQLDAMPLQVLIDATIVSVTLRDDLQYGIQWYFSQGRSGVGLNSSTALTQLGDAASTAALAAATGGFSAIYSSGSVKALLRAQSDLNNVNVISSPSLMVLNNQQAKINVGDQVPIQTSTLTNAIASTDPTTGGLAQASQIQYLDTGVTLEVTPRVNANGMVIMEIKQVVSTPVATTTGVTTSPTIQKKEIESFVAVKDGETIVLGGLIDNNNTYNRSGIPFLHELPWIGPLFGSTTRNDDKNELVVLITPRVVKSKQDSRIISDEFKRKLTGIYEVVPTVSKSIP